ncbi:MAG: gliding motility protein GldN [Spirosoma sp.]|nr:gliding motility protein GldN [Spirosoma sp.]
MIQAKNIRFAGLVATAALALAGGNVLAQEKAGTGVNPNSVRGINENDIMMKKTLWRRVDLKEKQNQSMFSKNNELPKYLIDAVKAGLLDAYSSDSLTTKITIEKMHEKLLVPNTAGGLSQEEIAAGFKEPGKDGTAADDGWGTPKKPDAKAKPADDGWGTPKKTAAAPADDGWGAPVKKVAAKPTKGKKGKKAAPAPVIEEPAPVKDTIATAPTLSGDEFFAKELNLIEIKEDWIFDRKRSRLYYDIQSVGIVLPADKNPAGFEIPVVFFKWKDLDKLFRSDPKKFIWYNPQNQAQHKNLADAFDLRLFYGRIWKESNPGDKSFVDLYGDKEGLIKSYQAEYELMEKEHGLWEY